MANQQTVVRSEPAIAQLRLPLGAPTAVSSVPVPSRDSDMPLDRGIVLQRLLAGDLDFKGQDSAYASHNFHAFAAKFPPQLPRRFIEGLTAPGETVLDPMMGSGTALLEAALLGRRSIGIDLDPLAVLQAQVKTTWLDPAVLESAGAVVVRRAHARLCTTIDQAGAIRARYTPPAAEFIEYWFLPAIQLQLLALVEAIKQLEPGPARDFMRLCFSSIIITKSGGVSRPRDLAHSRPHRVEGKVPRDAIEQFEARLRKNIRSLAMLPARTSSPEIRTGDARAIQLPDARADLVVTSPPYANAIDYMRAHKFSLVWFGEPMEGLTELRARYIGAERASDQPDAMLPPRTEQVIGRVRALDSKRGRVLRKYYLDMAAAIGEMYRVLRPGRAVVIVVGPSTMRGVDTETHLCLAELAAEARFDMLGVVERQLDRDKRMMPARFGTQRATGIEDRMHSEYVIAGIKRPAITAG